MKRYLLSALMVTGFSASMHAQGDVLKVVKIGLEIAVAGCSAIATPEVLAKCFYMPLPSSWQATSHFKEHDKAKTVKPWLNRIPVALIWSAALYYSGKKLLKRTKDLKKQTINIKNQS